MTLARAAELCGLPADLIETAATAYATGPSLLWLGQGVQRQRQGRQCVPRARGARRLLRQSWANQAPAFST